LATRSSVLHDLPFSVNKAGLSFRRLCDVTSKDVGLAPQPPGMAFVLHTLHELSDCTVNALVEHTHLPNGTLTGLLDALECDGHVQRLRNDADGRSWIVRLTPAGRRLCRKLDRRHATVMRLFSKALSDEESAKLVRLLAKLTTAMRGYIAAREASPSVVSGRSRAAGGRRSIGHRRSPASLSSAARGRTASAEPAVNV
jgi:DNA-binding MarR family transcriptional regulator